MPPSECTMEAGSGGILTTKTKTKKKSLLKKVAVKARKEAKAAQAS